MPLLDPPRDPTQAVILSRNYWDEPLELLVQALKASRKDLAVQQLEWTTRADSKRVAVHLKPRLVVHLKPRRVVHLKPRPVVHLKPRRVVHLKPRRDANP